MDFSTFSGSAYKLPGDFVKVQVLIQILGDSDAAGPGTTLEVPLCNYTIWGGFENCR